MASSVAVLGAGSWGTALAIHLARRGHAVRLWARDPDRAQRLREQRRSCRHPDVELASSITPTSELGAALGGVEAAVLACPSQAMRAVAREACASIPQTAVIVSTAKGIEDGTRQLMSSVLADVVGRQQAARVAVLSGPSFAREVALGLPTAVTAAAANVGVAERVQALFNGPAFRVYTSTDLIGVEIGGAVKNVIALAAGVSDGLGFGHNARAALITRGLAEISRLAVRLGADRQTLYGLSGLGDLVLTCTGDLSRNRSVGLRLGRGERLAEVLASMTEVAEGVRNTPIVCDLAEGVDVEMPIAMQMNAVLREAQPPRQAVVELMTRRLKQETE